MKFIVKCVQVVCKLLKKLHLTFWHDAFITVELRI